MNTQILFDKNGEAVHPDTEYLIDFDNGDGTYTAFFQNEADVAIIVRKLSELDAEDEFLDEKFWLEKVNCKQLGTRSCSGTCEQRNIGTSSFCRCSSDVPKKD